MRPVDLARRFAVSTNTLRNYEKRGLIPPAIRTTAGYRHFSEVHAAYLECLQHMVPAFGMETTVQALRLLLANRMGEAWRSVREREKELTESRMLAKRLVQELESSTASEDQGEHAQPMSIGTVAMACHVPASTLRYWEKAGFVAGSRCPGNDYRMYDARQQRKIRLMCAMRTAEYSEDTVQLKQSIAALPDDDARQMLETALKVHHYWEAAQFRQSRAIESIHALINR